MIPESSREALLEAMERFDREQRDTLDWRNWQTWRSFKHAIEHEGRLYPVKQIISLATGTPVLSFSGGPEANTYVERLGFEVVHLHPEDGVSDRIGDVLEVLAAVRASDPATAEDVREARRREILRIAATRDIDEGTLYDKLRRGLDLPSTNAFDNLVMGWVLEADMALRDRLEAHASATARAVGRGRTGWSGRGPRPDPTQDEVLALLQSLVRSRRQAGFLDDVSLPTSAPSETTMVLLRRQSSRAVLEALRELHLAAWVRLEEPALEAPLENLPVPYQLWCMLEVIDAVVTAAVAAGYQLKLQRLVSHDAAGVFVRVLPDGQPSVVLVHASRGTVLRLIPERTYAPGSARLRSLSYAQRPDIAIEVESPGERPVSTCWIRNTNSTASCPGKRRVRRTGSRRRSTSTRCTPTATPFAATTSRPWSSTRSSCTPARAWPTPTIQVKLAQSSRPFRPCQEPHLPLPPRYVPSWPARYCASGKSRNTPMDVIGSAPPTMVLPDLSEGQ